ncbi:MULTISPECIES: heavy-metal-associated domain-containing protein [Roseobacteraceae]|uniref:Copper chaperone CopZ n=2 Tax=Roseobacteraceae TaxID=2854170 RepID=A0A2R8BQU1_9RHOB|nr:MULTISPECIES: heavy-metal-associated domain-containing protein [Roseobacteraceae]MDT0684064.1 heavy-metal-associated domain-containing protein [Roseicyclus sp. F158]SPJ22527.1 Copper chaperone CopZ [Palleronia abyssalis]
MTILNVPGMNCGHCRAAVEQAIASVDSAATPHIDLGNKIVSLESAASDQKIIDALAARGYPATVAA